MQDAPIFDAKNQTQITKGAAPMKKNRSLEFLLSMVLHLSQVKSTNLINTIRDKVCQLPIYI